MQKAEQWEVDFLNEHKRMHCGQGGLIAFTRLIKLRNGFLDLRQARQDEVDMMFFLAMARSDVRYAGELMENASKSPNFGNEKEK